MAYALPERNYAFSSGRVKTGQKPGRRKSAKKFVPTQEQVKTAMRRIEGYLNRMNGAQPLAFESSTQDLARLLVPKLFNRGFELGSMRDGEVAIVVELAVRQMFADGKLAMDNGWLALTMPRKPRRAHRNKYPRHQGRRVAA